MPTVGSHNKAKSVGKNRSHTNDEVIKMSRPELARDDLREAFAGHENKGPAGKDKTQQHSTNVKSRQTEKSKARTPIR